MTRRHDAHDEETVALASVPVTRDGRSSYAFEQVAVDSGNDRGGRRAAGGAARRAFGEDDDLGLYYARNDGARRGARHCGVSCGCVAMTILFTVAVGTLVASAAFTGISWRATVNSGAVFDDCGIVTVAPQATFAASIGALALAALTYVAWMCCRRGDSCCTTKGWCCASTAVVLWTVVLCVGGLVGVFVGQLLWAFAAQQPSLSGDVTLSRATYNGLPRAPVTIVRDVNGLPHIQAETQLDLIFGQAFAQAQDRLWQLEFMRLVGKGELAKHVGDAGLSMDRQTRTLGVVRAAAAVCAGASVATQEALAAFASGVNAFLATTSQRPIEFYFMSTSWWPLHRHEPEPFQASDGCIAAKLLQLSLGDNMKLEMQRFRMWWAQGKPGAIGATVRDINTLYFNQSNITDTILTAADLGITQGDVDAQRAADAASFAAEAAMYESVLKPLRDAAWTKDPSNGHVAAAETGGGSARSPATAAASLWSGFGLPRVQSVNSMIRKHASNAWAARRGGDGTTACGASDPHLDINLPSVWYYQHLAIVPSGATSPTWEASGVSMTGIPGIHIGKTQQVSWGITMAITDLQDLYIMTPDPAAPATRYLLKNGTSVPYTIRTEAITVKDGFSKRTEQLTIRETYLGPDVAPVMDGLDKIGLPMALHSPILQPDATSADAVLAFMDPSIGTVQALCDMVFRKLRSPAFSVPSADSHGNIGYCISGAYHRRPLGHTGMWPTLGDGTMDPIPGDIPDALLPSKFVGAATIDAMPRDTGASISTANQKIYPDGYPLPLGFDYIPPFRGGRLHELLLDPRNAEQLSSIAFHEAVQTDVQSNMWVHHLLPMLVNDNATATAFRAGVATNTVAQAALSALFRWDGRAPIGSTETALLWGWLRLLSQVTAPVTDAIDMTPWSEYMFVPSMLQGAASRDNATIAFTEALCTRALDASGDTASVSQLRVAFAAAGTDAVQCWSLATAQFVAAANGGYAGKRWGIEVGQLEAVNLMMHGSPLECIFDRTMHKDGDVTSVDVNEFVLFDNPMTNGHAASSMRQLYDWGNTSSVRFAWPGGASGYPYSPRYFNLAPNFVQDAYVVVPVQGGVAAVTGRSDEMQLLPSP